MRMREMQIFTNIVNMRWCASENIGPCPTLVAASRPNTASQVLCNTFKCIYQGADVIVKVQKGKTSIIFILRRAFYQMLGYCLNTWINTLLV